MSSTVFVTVKRSTIEKGNAELLLKEVRNYLNNKPKINALEIENKFKLYLSNKGLSKTPERLKIIEKICIDDYSFNIYKIYGRVIKDLHVSIETIIRTFELLIEANIIKRIYENEKSELFKTTNFELRLMD